MKEKKRVRPFIWTNITQWCFVPRLKLFEIGPLVLEQKVFNSCQFILFPNYLSLRKCRGPSLNKLEPPLKVFNNFLFIFPWERFWPFIEQRILFTQGCFATRLLKVRSLVLDKKIKIWQFYKQTDERTTNAHLSFSSGELIIATDFEITLYITETLLTVQGRSFVPISSKVVQWFDDFYILSKGLFFAISYNLPLEMDWLFLWINLNSLDQRMIYSKFEWNEFSIFGEADFKFCHCIFQIHYYIPLEMGGNL